MKNRTPILYRSTRKQVANLSNLPSEDTYNKNLPRNLSNLPSEWNKDGTRTAK